MTYIIDKMKLTEKQDRRIKLSTEQKEEIKRLYSTGGYSLNNLAKKYGVSKRLILITVNDESKRNMEEKRKVKWKKYYDKDKHREQIKNTRKYKNELYKNGELK